MPALPRGVGWAIAFALVLAGIWYVTQGSPTETMEPLFGGRALRDLELDQVEIAFSATGLTSWRREDGQILIPRATRHEYLAALEHSSALPYALKSSVEEAFRGGSYFESESQRSLRHQYAKAHDLGNKIATFDDILWASVDYDEQNTGGFDKKIIQSASVILVPKNGKPIPPGRIQMIQDCVCGSYAGMKPEQVTVTDTSAQKTYNGSDDPQIRQQRQAEYELEQRLTELLGGYQGLHIAATSKAVDSSPDSNIRANGSVMRVSVGVPESLYHQQWANDHRSEISDQQLSITPTSEQLAIAKNKVIENIRDAVSPFVAVAGDQDDRTIRVWSFPDANQDTHVVVERDPTVGLAAIIASAKTHAWTLVPMICLLLVGIVFGGAAMRMRFRQSRIDTNTVTDRSTKIPSAGQSESGPSASATNETTLRADLAELVESNPELAAQIVHSWIAEAA